MGGSLAHCGIYGSQSSICRTWFSPSITCVPETEPMFWALTASTLISALLNQTSILMQSTKILGFHSHPCTHSCVCFVRARCHGFSSSFTLRARWFYIPHWILLPTLSTSLREGCYEVTGWDSLWGFALQLHWPHSLNQLSFCHCITFHFQQNQAKFMLLLEMAIINL